MIPTIDPYVILVAIIAIFLAILSALCILIAIRNNRRKHDRQSSPERTALPSRSPVRSSLASTGRNDLPSHKRSLAITPNLASRSGLAIPSRTTALPALPSSASHAIDDAAIKSDINAIINKHLSKEPTQ